MSGHRFGAGKVGERKAGPGKIRIIGGRWKRTVLPVVAGEGLRPTPDRVRETLFNWLGQDLAGLVVLDLFAGTGALGFEAASRGAAQVVMVEQAPSAVQALRQTVARLPAPQVKVVAADAVRWLIASGETGASPAPPFDLVFLDPPFGRGLLARVLPLVACRLSPAGRVYVESDLPIDDAVLAGWKADALSVSRGARAGQVHYHLLHARPPGATTTETMEQGRC